jgi:hypothetical protein
MQNIGDAINKAGTGLGWRMAQKDAGLITVNALYSHTTS